MRWSNSTMLTPPQVPLEASRGGGGGVADSVLKVITLVSSFLMVGVVEKVNPPKVVPVVPWVVLGVPKVVPVVLWVVLGVPKVNPPDSWAVLGVPNVKPPVDGVEP